MLREKRKNKTVIFLGDGMADEPVPALDGKTPLQYAKTPAMDSIARDGVNGSLLTLPTGFPTSSEVANMSILGCDLETEYCGRGPLEALGRNIELGPDDIAFRINLTTVENGILKDSAGGHIGQEDAEGIVATLNAHWGSKTIRFHSGVSYRNLLILSGKEFSNQVYCEKPDDNQGQPVSEHLPSPINTDGEKTAAFFRELMLKSATVLEECPVNRKLADTNRQIANGLWPWSGGTISSMKSLKEKYGISGAVISAVDVIIGLGRALGLDVINVPGVTGYIDTNYEGKADAALEALKTRDFVYIHLEAIDEVSHEKNLAKKIQAIEDFDSRIVARVLEGADFPLNAAILPDHPVPVRLGKHTRTPVPVAVKIAGRNPDSVKEFNELTCQAGSLGLMKKDGLMNLLFVKS